MSKRKKKSADITWLLVSGLVIVVAAGAVAYYLSGNLRHGIKPPARKPMVLVTPSHPNIVPSRKLVIFLPQETSDDVYLVPVARTTSAKGDILDVATDMLLAMNKRGGIYADLIPKGTRLLSPIKVKGKIATVNLSKEFTDNFSGGIEQEALTLNSIVHTLVSNSDGKVSSVRILVEGETAETLGGHFELTDPITADSTLLRPSND